jgi:hypothetical protein
MKMIKTLSVTLALAGLTAITANAIPINGSINFAGGVDLSPDGSIATATSISFSSTFTTAPNTGSYAPVIFGVPVVFHGFQFSPFVAPVPDLWDFTYLGLAYSFDAITETFVQRNTGGSTQSLILQGNGIAHITGFDATPGAWIITVNTADGGVTFSFSASSSATPDGGTTVVLLGAALSGLAWVNALRKK